MPNTINGENRFNKNSEFKSEISMMNPVFIFFFSFKFSFDKIQMYNYFKAKNMDDQTNQIFNISFVFIEL